MKIFIFKFTVDSLMSWVGTKEVLTLSICPSEEATDLYKDIKNEKGDSGSDLYCPNDITVPAGARSFCIDLKISVSMHNFIHISHTGADVKVPLEVPRGCLLYPRSSMGSTTTLRLCNSVGVIDAGYRGHVKAFVDNVGDKDVVISRGVRLFQICSGDLSPFDTKIVASLNSTERGDKGFGSTGGTVVKND